MLRNSIIQPDQSYSFSDYFCATIQRRSRPLPRYTGELDRLTDLKARIEE